MKKTGLILIFLLVLFINKGCGGEAYVPYSDVIDVYINEVEHLEYVNGLPELMPDVGYVVLTNGSEDIEPKAFRDTETFLGLELELAESSALYIGDRFYSHESVHVIFTGEIILSGDIYITIFPWGTSLVQFLVCKSYNYRLPKVEMTDMALEMFGESFGMIYLDSAFSDRITEYFYLSFPHGQDEPEAIKIQNVTIKIIDYGISGGPVGGMGRGSGAMLTTYHAKVASVISYGVAADATECNERGFLYKNFFDFDGDGGKEFLVLSEACIFGDSIIAEIWDVTDEIETMIWSKEFSLIPIVDQLFAVHEFMGRAYFVYTRISDSDWGYFRKDYFFSMINGSMEEINNFRAVWNEVLHDPYSYDFIIDSQRRFYINDIAVSEYEYQRALSQFGLELVPLKHTHEFDCGFVREWHTSEIYFSNPLLVFYGDV